MYKLRYAYLGQVSEAWVRSEVLVQMVEYPTFTYTILAYCPQESN